jgi:Secretion system C-terminal sorting domain
MKKITLFLVFVTLGFSVSAQGVKAALTVTNQTITGSDYTFDIYINTVAGTTGDLFLGNADFVFNFNTAKFTSPVLSKVGPSPGSLTFVPIDNPTSNSYCRLVNYARISPAAVTGNELIINLADPAPSDQDAFDTAMPKITSTPLTHCLGRFKLTGLMPGTTISEVNLQWKMTGSGVLTDLYSLENIVVNPVPPNNPYPSYVVMLSANVSALPLDLLSFNANTQDNKHTQLAWLTAQERNVDGFDLQRSKKGTTWETIGFVPSKNVNDAKYEFTDLNIHQGNQSETFYYRLKIKDLDGTFEFSNIEKVVFKGKNSNVTVFPNPATDVLNLQWSEVINEEITLTLIDITGKVIINQKVFINDKHTLELSNTLAQGDYVLKVFSENIGKISSQVVTILK